MPSQYGEQIARIDERTETMMDDCKDIKRELRAMNDRQRKDHEKITELETKMGIVGGLQAAFTSIAALLAAWWGTQR